MPALVPGDVISEFLIVGDTELIVNYYGHRLNST
jgi:hypothetical protein